MGWFSKATPQQKADSFDAQFEQSQREAKRLQEQGLYPYDLDAKIGKAGEAPKPSRRKKDKKK